VHEKHCQCPICQAARIKNRNKELENLRIAKEFEEKSGGTISKNDILEIINKK
jgi:hypothetical protein